MIATLCFPISETTITLANKKRGFGSGNLNGYGGKAKNGEDVLTTLCREFIEEGGVTILPEDVTLMAIIDFFEESTHLFECHIFFLKNLEAELQETEEMGPPEEFSRANLPFDRMWKGDKIWLPILCAGDKIRAKAIYKKGMEEIDRFDQEPLDIVK